MKKQEKGPQKYFAQPFFHRNNYLEIDLEIALKRFTWKNVQNYKAIICIQKDRSNWSSNGKDQRLISRYITDF